MNKEAVAYYGRKFFGHLIEPFRTAAAQAVVDQWERPPSAPEITPYPPEPTAS